MTSDHSQDKEDSDLEQECDTCDRAYKAQVADRQRLHGSLSCLSRAPAVISIPDRQEGSAQARCSISRISVQIDDVIRPALMSSCSANEALVGKHTAVRTGFP